VALLAPPVYPFGAAEREITPENVVLLSLVVKEMAPESIVLSLGMKVVVALGWVRY
jgi:hypothetical protein